MDSSLSGIIESLRLRESLSEYDYDHTKRHLGLIESSWKSDKEKLASRCDAALKDVMILTKQLEEYKRDRGELMLTNNGTQRELTESRTECAYLRVRLAALDQELQRLNSLKDLSSEVKLLEKQNKHLTEENAGLEAKKAEVDAVLRVLKAKEVKLEEEVKEMRKKLKKAEKDVAENSEIRVKNSILKRDLDDVMTAANVRFKSFEKRISDLERAVAALNENASKSELVNTTQVIQEQESFGVVVKHEGFAGALSGHETTPTEEKTASSLPSPNATSATRVQGQPSFESDTRRAGPLEAQIPVAEEKSASSSPCVPRSASASAPPSFVVLSDSDDDGELPLAKGHKRKQLSEISFGVRTQMESISPSKKTMAALKPCKQRAGVLPGNSKKNWDYEVDLLKDLHHSTELCMMGLCALYRQQMLMPFTFSATNLANFLTDGDAQGGLKKTLADLKKFHPEAADDCQKIAVAHSRQLFDIYNNGKDPFFARDLVFCWKTIV